LWTTPQDYDDHTENLTSAASITDEKFGAFKNVVFRRIEGKWQENGGR
jgi:hypothetical protein